MYAAAPGEGAQLSIGALSRAAHVPIDTLRTWERRYGFPRPLERESSSHRRYPVEAVERLRLIKRVLALGHKPAQVVGAEVEALRELLALPQSDELAPRSDAAAMEEGIERWFVAVQAFDSEAFDAELARYWDRLGAMRFLSECAGPFLHELGRRWEQKTLSVAHEHFASERMRDFLASRRAGLGGGARGGIVVCATLPDDQHTLGAHMAAIVLSLLGLEVLFLGANSPIAEIVRAAADQGAAGVAISVSAGYDPARLRAHLVELARALPSGVSVLAGGSGLSVAPPGIVRLTDFEQLIHHCQTATDWTQTDRVP
jgi:MerR family transcriptional regulator, light-induced transcriptional regulator